MTEYYAITVQGELDEHWRNWFDGLKMTHNEEGETVLIGRFADQAALHGVLTRVRDLGLTLVSVNRVDRDLETTSDCEKLSADTP